MCKHYHEHHETHNHYYGVSEAFIEKHFHSLNIKIDKIMADQKAMAEDMNAVTAQLQKIGNESAKSLEKIAELQAAIDAQPNVTPELQTAFDNLKAQVKLVDDMVPDAAEPPAEG